MSVFQCTIAQAVTFTGIGIHSGKKASVTINPAAENTGIVFIRKDQTTNNEIQLNPNNVVNPIGCTRLVNPYGIDICVVEHLLASLKIVGISNAIIETSCNEVPIMDGSAKAFVESFEKIGIINQRVFANTISINQPIRVSDGNSVIDIIPHNKFEIEILLDYEKINKIHNISNKAKVTIHNLRSVATARTFGWLSDYEIMLQSGLAKGASQENTVIIGEEKIINGPLRFNNELARHKILDLIGDLFVANCSINAKFICTNPSHKLNNIAVREILAQEASKQAAMAYAC